MQQLYCVRSLGVERNAIRKMTNWKKFEEDCSSPVHSTRAHIVLYLCTAEQENE